MGEGLTKAGESGLVGAEAHPAEHGLAGEVGAPGQGTRAQRGPLVQSSKVGPGWGDVGTLSAKQGPGSEAEKSRSPPPLPPSALRLCICETAAHCRC